MNCVFCNSDGGELLWRDEVLRIVRVIDEPNYPGFCRVIWHEHVSEFSALTAAQRTHLMNVVAALERVLHKLMQPTKINLASLGNQVPHLHWHVIPRYQDDAHFPAPIWASRVRTVDPALLSVRNEKAEMLGAAILDELKHAL